MRYFKCPHANKTEKEIYKAQLAVLDERAKRLVQKEKFLSIVIGVIFLAVVIAAFSLFNMFFTFLFKIRKHQKNQRNIPYLLYHINSSVI